VDPGVEKVDPVENVEQVDPEPEEDDDPLMKRIDALETSVSGLLDVVKGLGKPRKIKVEAKEPEDETEKLQKQVDELTLEAKSSRVKSTIKAAIKEGKAIPAMEESLVALGLADEDKFNDMMAKMPQMVDFTEHSKKDKSLEAKAPKMSKEEQKEYKEYRELKAKKRNTGIIASDKKE
jgi:phage I-like protein